MFFASFVTLARATRYIIVTGRPPTHHIKAYNRSGEFVRKLGSLELQHPLGVAVDLSFFERSSLEIDSIGATACSTN